MVMVKMAAVMTFMIKIMVHCDDVGGLCASQAEAPAASGRRPTVGLGLRIQKLSTCRPASGFQPR